MKGIAEVLDGCNAEMKKVINGEHIKEVFFKVEVHGHVHEVTLKQAGAAYFRMLVSMRAEEKAEEEEKEELLRILLGMGVKEAARQFKNMLLTKLAGGMD